MLRISLQKTILSLCLACSLSSATHAGEGLFGFLYTLDMQPKGTYEFEQRADVTHGQQTGSYNLGMYRTALEYGLSDNLQVAGYLNAYSIQAKKNYTNPDMCDGDANPCNAGFGVPSSAHDADSYRKFTVDGGSLELIWRAINPVTSPVGVGLYVEPTLGRLEDSLEVRLLLQSNFLDDRLIVALNLLYEPEKEKYDNAGTIRNSMGDILYGASYRFAPNWSAGIEGRLHTDHDGYFWNEHTQTAHFIGPTIHYASQKWWATAAWRYQLQGKCFADGTADCATGYNKVSDNHGRNQFVVKFGLPFG
ncbi:DUF6662 family protein [Acinetobacter boissieri]|uniref:MetA-pathway of phenol degradation n=1 Tax=Acinetobacter boissieri TaxID=1219383 RepID=A0A1G6GW01_9GAMM|nr:DUF6662 family protein [Acinetobacter boissieri]SDB85306.1 hypothetical protein SAMN05421733_102205 [Acinetobacter boissieri]